jgi:ribosomal protein S4
LEEEVREEEEEVGEKKVEQKVREEVGQDVEVNINKRVLVQYWTKKTIRHFFTRNKNSIL